jgi:multidrug resistance efflux pump
MDLLLILTYTGICVAVFKFFKIPLNKWSVPTAVLGGVFLIGTLIFLMNYNHPYSEVTRNYYITTPIYSEVRARVNEVMVQPNQKVAKGDVLFTLDTASFEDEITGLEAKILAAQKDYDRAVELKNKGVGSTRDVDQTQASLDSLKSQLEEANYKLDQTTVYAPSDGTVVQLALRPGMMALPIRPVMTFLHDEDGLMVGWYRQNSTLRLKTGDKAEIAFDSIPGEVFEAEVVSVFPVIGEGQVQPNGDYMRFAQQLRPGRVAVGMKITDPDFAEYKLPLGSFAQSAIYTDHFTHVAVMRKILLRMAAWMNYIFPFH